MLDRAAALVRDIEAIPGMLDRMAAADGLQDALRTGIGASWTPRRIVLTGLGSSRFAALDVAADIRALGMDVIVEPASTDRPAPPAADCLCVAISSSGRTPEVLAAAERHRGVSRVLAITRDARSRLAGLADSVAVIPVQAEESGIATTSYVATIAVLQYLVAAISADAPASANASPALLLARAAADAREVLGSRSAWLPAVLGIVREIESLSILAPWSARGAAEQIALLFREAPRRSTDVAETAEWLHTGIYTALPGSVAMILAGSPGDVEATRTIAGRAGRVIAVSTRLAVPQPPVSAVIPAASGAARIVGPALVAAELWRALPTPPPEW